MFYIEGGDGNFISYGQDTQTHTQTHRSTYRGGAHLKMIHWAGLLRITFPNDFINQFILCCFNFPCPCITWEKSISFSKSLSLGKSDPVLRYFYYGGGIL